MYVILFCLARCGAGSVPDKIVGFNTDTDSGCVEHRALLQMPVHLRVHRGAEFSAYELVGEGVTWWEDVLPGAFEFWGWDDVGTSTPNDVVVKFNDVVVGDLAVLGLTSYEIDDKCEMRDTHIDINFVHAAPDTDHTNRNVMIHEMGHVLGLAHDKDKASVMYPYVQPGDPVLSPETIDSLHEIYDAKHSVTTED